MRTVCDRVNSMDKFNGSGAKRNGSLRICLDPKDLNRAIQHHHYPLPTIEDIATRLYGAKLFTVVDVKVGLWHVVMDHYVLHPIWQIPLETHAS